MEARTTEIHEAFRKFANPGSLYYIWVFDPQSGEAEAYDADGHVLDTPSHYDLARKHPNEDRLHGYAYRIIGGWRITDWQDRPVPDPYVIRKVKEALSASRQDQER